jgi:hypothetical protein
MSNETSPLRWEPPSGPMEKKDQWTRIIFEAIEVYPEADVIVTKEDTGEFWTVLAIVALPEARVLTELTHAIVGALTNAGLPAKAAS